jgi:hypothetical protein
MFGLIYKIKNLIEMKLGKSKIRKILRENSQYI